MAVALEFPAITGTDAVVTSVTVPPVEVVPSWNRTVEPSIVEYAVELEMGTEKVVAVPAIAVVGEILPAARSDP